MPSNLLQAVFRLSCPSASADSSWRTVIQFAVNLVYINFKTALLLLSNFPTQRYFSQAYSYFQGKCLIALPPSSQQTQTKQYAILYLNSYVIPSINLSPIQPITVFFFLYNLVCCLTESSSNILKIDKIFGYFTIKNLIIKLHLFKILFFSIRSEYNLNRI